MEVFKGWTIAIPKRGRMYPQIETVRYTRREAIEKGARLYSMTLPTYRMDEFLFGEGIKKRWSEMRKLGHKAIRVTLAEAPHD